MPLHIVRDDIANMRTDAIVVPANTMLLIGGGAGEAVARIAGMGRLQDACDTIGGCAIGEAVVTPAFDFPAKMIVHAVGPVWRGGYSGEAGALRSCVSAALAVAVSAGAESIAMPLLATGAFGYPVGHAIDIETRAIQDFLDSNEIDVWLVLYDRESMRMGRALFDSIAEYIDDVYVGDHAFERTAALDGYPPQVRGFDRGFAPGVPSIPGMSSARSVRSAQSADRETLPTMPTSASPSTSLPESKRGGRLKSRDKGRGLFGRRRTRGGDTRPDARLDMSQVKPPASSREEREQEPAMAGDAAALEDMAAFEDVSLEEVAFGSALPRHFDGVARVGAAAPESLAKRLERLDESFAQTVLRLIDERGMTDVEVYKRANMSRQLFAKIRKDDNYRPTKKTACALAFALGLNRDDAVALLARAGFALSHSSKFDVIVEYFLVNNVHDIFQVNEALFAYDQPILG
ncbi:macro domain-containing protein [Adlercreutzia sp. ZJ138]|uniref:macro domain-containing protein n=1 Tax=Adlercreutzia sp. ZJ138 TaxID=2709405 RepID=UPI0013EA511D|nr:macro domain-containing protein [Adlercreutzia sp. ZJ138]